MPFKKIIRFLPPILWMGMMFFLSSRSDLPSNQVYVYDFITKKIAHVSEYFVLTLLWAWSLRRPSPDFAVIFSLIYAFTDETHQLFVPNRTGNLRDVGIDFIGISVAALLALKLQSWKIFTSPHPSRTPKKSLRK